jgi:hypothetical protein
MFISGLAQMGGQLATPAGGAPSASATEALQGKAADRETIGSDKPKQKGDAR